MPKTSFPAAPLVIHVLGDVPDDSNHERHRLARALYTRFNRDYDNSLSRGIGIPVYFWGAPGSASRIRPEDARHSVFVPLVDDELVMDSKWSKELKRLHRLANDSGGAHRIFPVALTESAFNAGLGNTNFIRLQRLKDFEARSKALVERLTHELCRLLYGREPRERARQTRAAPSLKLFISHAKLDGVEFAQRIRDYVHDHLDLGTFFDAVDIPPGTDFTEELERNAASASLISIQTDAYGTREWCRREVLVAKTHGRPVIVVNAVSQGEERSFPYLGNVPTLRWEPDRPDDDKRASAVVALMQREVLRDAYFREHLKALGAVRRSAGTYAVLPRPPELVTFPGTRKPGVILYPDPPLGDEEVEVLARHHRRTRLLTPTLMAHQDDRHRPLRLDGRMVGISVATNADVGEHGCTEAHLQDATLQFARYLLACGARFAYGGDLRERGYTQQMMQLVRQYNRAGEKARLHSFLTWTRDQPSTSTQAAFHPVVKFNLIKPPRDVAADTGKQTLTEDRRAYVRARCHTRMREKMNERIDARVVLGGKLSGFSGRYPGILEEVLLALQRGIPTFIVGGFGGCAGAIAQALSGETPEFLTEEFQRANPAYDALFRQYQSPDSKAEPPDYAASVAFLNRKGIKGLDNGLSRQENQRLFKSVNLDEITTLVFKGLTTRLGKPAGR